MGRSRRRTGLRPVRDAPARHARLARARGPHLAARARPQGRPDRLGRPPLPVRRVVQRVLGPARPGRVQGQARGEQDGVQQGLGVGQEPGRGRRRVRLPFLPLLLPLALRARQALLTPHALVLQREPALPPPERARRRQPHPVRQPRLGRRRHRGDGVEELLELEPPRRRVRQPRPRHPRRPRRQRDQEPGCVLSFSSLALSRLAAARHRADTLPRAQASTSPTARAPLALPLRPPPPSHPSAPPPPPLRPPPSASRPARARRAPLPLRARPRSPQRPAPRTPTPARARARRLPPRARPSPARRGAASPAPTARSAGRRRTVLQAQVQAPSATTLAAAAAVRRRVLAAAQAGAVGSPRRPAGGDTAVRRP